MKGKFFEDFLENNTKFSVIILGDVEYRIRKFKWADFTGRFSIEMGDCTAKVTRKYGMVFGKFNENGILGFIRFIVALNFPISFRTK